MDIRYKAFYAWRMNDSAEVKAVPENTIIAYVIPGAGFENGDEILVKAERDPFAPAPHFGSGTVTWYLPFLFRTPPRYGMMVTRPASPFAACCRIR